MKPVAVAILYDINKYLWLGMFADHRVILTGMCTESRFLEGDGRAVLGWYFFQSRKESFHAVGPDTGASLRGALPSMKASRGTCSVSIVVCQIYSTWNNNVVCVIFLAQPSFLNLNVK